MDPPAMPALTSSSLVSSGLSASRTASEMAAAAVSAVTSAAHSTLVASAAALRKMCGTRARARTVRGHLVCGWGRCARLNAVKRAIGHLQRALSRENLEKMVMHPVRSRDACMHA